MSATGGPSKVFISYRRSESGGHAGRLYDAMAARFGDSNVFMDIEMQPGVDFVERITTAVGGCHILLVVIGRDWARAAAPGERSRLDDPDDFVRLEVATALRRSDVTIIPLLVEDAQMPDPDELPASLRALTRRNALELSDSRWRADVGRLFDVIDALLDAAGPSSTDPPHGAADPPRPAGASASGWLRRHAWPVGTGTAVAVAAVLGFMLASGGDDEQPPPQQRVASKISGVRADVAATCTDLGTTDERGAHRADRHWSCPFPDPRGVLGPSLSFFAYGDPRPARAEAESAVAYERSVGWTPCRASEPMPSYRGTWSCLVATKEVEGAAGTIEILWNGERSRVFGEATFAPGTSLRDAVAAWARLVSADDQSAST